LVLEGGIIGGMVLGKEYFRILQNFDNIQLQITKKPLFKGL